MTDSMNFGPEWLRNLSSEGTTTGMGGGGSRCQLADYRYGREDMLALYEKGLPPPQSLTLFPPIYSETVLSPLALVPATDEERQWAARAPSLGPSTRGGRGAPGIGERGGRGARGARGAYQPFVRTLGSSGGGGYDVSGGVGGGWGGTGEQTEWSPRKDFTYNRSTSSGGIDNWRRNNRSLGEDEDGWRTTGSHGRGGGPGEKWNRASSWREGDEEARDKRWHEPATGATRGGAGGQHRRMWDSQDEHLPEWATENLAEGGGTFDSSGAFHGSDDEHDKGKELQKSASQHNIRNQHTPLVTSKSAVALSINKNNKPDIKQEDKNARYHHPEHDDAKSKERTPTERELRQEHMEESQLHRKATHPMEEQNNPAPTPVSLQTQPTMPTNPNSNKSNNAPAEIGGRVVDEDFDKLQEDFVSKLVVDEELPKNPTNLPNVNMSNGIPAPPPNIIPPPQVTQEKWYYQDPQGDLQGPFLSSEMAEWFKAGYFSTNLFVRRQCDTQFYTLGELVTLSNGNPFLATVPVAPPKQEKFADPEMALHYQQQFLQAQMMRGRPFGQGEPWSGVRVPRDMYAPPMMPPMGPEMMPLMLNQFKMPQVPVQQPGMDEPLAASNAMHMDPLRRLVQSMGGLQTRMQQAQGIPAQPGLGGMPANGTMPPKTDTGKMEPTDFIQFIQQHAALGKMQQAQLEQRIDLDSLWKRNQFQQQQAQQSPHQQAQQPPPNSMQATPQWAQSDKPISMWDPPTVPTSALQQVLQGNMPPTSQPMINHVQLPESPVLDVSEKKSKKEDKKQKELEEKQAKKEAEELRKQEQRKQELEKKQQEEKRKKEEDRIRRELEKAKKEAEEKRMKELAEKKRLKEQRKEEEARKKAADELKKQEDEKEKIAAKERDEIKKQQAEMQRQMALATAAANQKPAKIAPWSQATSNQGLSLSEIQKIERERKAEQVIMLQQQQAIQQQQQRQLQQAMQEQAAASPEKMNSFGVPLNWANKPMRPNHAKSFAEIQAEEQERLAKQKEKEKAAQKEKETLSPPTSTIWCGQSLTWNNSDGPGFWDEPVYPPPTQLQKKPQAPVQVQVKQSGNKQPQQASSKKQQPAKQQKEQANNNANSNNSEVNSSDEFTNWCIRTLANMNTQVDIPTFVSFLRTIESALDVRDYCREYLGEKPPTQQFAAQFLEKRRSFKPKPNAHKDDMCSPAPAITPSTQHSNDFQEVKGKGKKVKKSKMLKVDARILGFNVTAAQDRINVGDRDYGEA